MVADEGVQDECEWMDGSDGVDTECTGAKCVHGLCGSGITNRCGTGASYAFAMQCCGKSKIYGLTFNPFKPEFTIVILIHYKLRTCSG